jgi:exopolysaccharide production protein ExoQ
MELSATIGNPATGETSRVLVLCAITGFILAFKGSLTFLFFRSSPQGGAGVTVALTLTWMLLVWGYTILDSHDLSLKDAGTRIPRWILIYLALAGASLAWTTTNSVPVAAAYWSATVADVIVIWLLLRYQSQKRTIIRIMHGFIVGAAVVAIIAWAAPAMDDLRLGNEDFLHPNLIGFEFAVAALFSAYLAQRNNAWTCVCAAFVVTLIRTLSKGTIVGFLFSSLYYVVHGLKISRKVRAYIGVAGALLLLAFWGLVEAYLDLYTQGSNLETLTGRTYIWTTSLDIASEKLWFGHGFDSFRWVFPPFGTFQPWHAHNEWIQQVFAYGIVGLFVVVAVYVSFYRTVRTSHNQSLKSLATAVLVLVLVRGLVDTDRFELCFPLWLMTMLSISLAGTPSPDYAE